MRWWLGAVALASAWWMLPLLVLGRYSPPFLDYIETSAAVVGPLGWTNVARGADHWVSYVFVGGQPWWPGSYELSTDALLVAATGLVAAAGLWGLTRPEMPLRRPLLLSLLVGMICLTVARSGPLESPVHQQFQVLLDGPLSMLRNVHKVDPLVRLPLALGLAQLSTAWWPAAGRRWAGTRTMTAALVVVVLLVSAQPLWSGNLRKSGWSDVPAAWSQAAAYLEAQEGTGSTLVLPGSGFGQQSWGWTIDEPIQGLATTPWATRSQVPLTPGSTIRNLDAIQERISDGQGSPALAMLLARAGIEYVLVRRDLDIFASGAPDPARVDLAISRSPGLVLAASFGRSGFGEQPMIDVYRVDRDVERVEAVDLDDVRTLAGGPEDVLTALESGTLDPESPVVIAGEAHWPDATPDLVADGYRKRERAFGRLEDALGEVMSRDEPYRVVRSAHDYPGVPGVERVYAQYDGIDTVTASTSGGYADALGAGPSRGRAVRRRGRAARDLLAVLTADRPGRPVGRAALLPTHRPRTDVDPGRRRRLLRGADPSAQGHRRQPVPRRRRRPVHRAGRGAARRQAGRPRPGDGDGRGRRRRGCRAAGDLLARRADRSPAGRPGLRRRGHVVRAARAPAAARVHRRGARRELWLHHRAPGSARRSRGWCARSP